MGFKLKAVNNHGNFFKQWREDSKNGVEGHKMRFYRYAKTSSLGTVGQDKDLEFNPKCDKEPLKTFK